MEVAAVLGEVVRVPHKLLHLISGLDNRNKVFFCEKASYFSLTCIFVDDLHKKFRFTSNKSSSPIINQ